MIRSFLFDISEFRGLFDLSLLIIFALQSFLFLLRHNQLQTLESYFEEAFLRDKMPVQRRYLFVILQCAFLLYSR
jgi:hypothetical protein